MKKQFRNTKQDIWSPKMELPSNIGDVWMEFFRIQNENMHQ